jgi:hypothetical protein
MIQFLHNIVPWPYFFKPLSNDAGVPIFQMHRRMLLDGGGHLGDKKLFYLILCTANTLQSITVTFIYFRFLWENGNSSVERTRNKRWATISVSPRKVLALEMKM